MFPFLLEFIVSVLYILEYIVKGAKYKRLMTSFRHFTTTFSLEISYTCCGANKKTLFFKFIHKIF